MQEKKKNLFLPPSIEDKFGRLVGVTELEKGPASKTRWDVPPGCRNDVLRGKQVIHQEYSQPYSPVAKWMGLVDMALNDEGQQCGLQLARVPSKGLVVWCGHHKQTPGDCAKVKKPGRCQQQ